MKKKYHDKELPLGLKERKGQFLVLGRAGLDLYPHPEGSKIFSAHMFRSDLGGSAGNICVSLIRNGFSASLIGAISDDPVGKFVKEKLKEYGIGIKYLYETDGRMKTSLALAEIRREDCEVVIYRNNAADLDIQKEHLHKINLASAKGLIITGTALSAEPSRSVVFELVESANTEHCPVIFDIDYRKDAWSIEEAYDVYQKMLDFTDILVGNEEEFSVMFKNENNGTWVEQTYPKSLLDSKIISIIKRGKKGCSIVSKSINKAIDIYQVEEKKPFGAGDAFLGAFLARTAEGKSLAEAAQSGAASAAITVSRNGCASSIPTKEEIENFQTIRSRNN